MNFQSTEMQLENKAREGTDICHQMAKMLTEKILSTLQNLKAEWHNMLKDVFERQSSITC